MPQRKEAGQGELIKIDDFLKESPLSKPLSPTQLRVIGAAESQDAQQILYQHTVFCQVGLPYRDPGLDVTEWKRKNGAVSILVTTKKYLNPLTGEWEQRPLPFGPKPRLFLGDANTQAIQKQSREIDLEASLTRFVKRLRLDPCGRNIRTVKDAIARTCAAQIQLSVPYNGAQTGLDTQIMSGSSINLWFPKNDRQRVLWPSMAEMSLDYFNILMKHAVPLDERAYFALSHNSLAMDIYAWLTQRLHRIPSQTPHLVTWVNLHDQFGWHYTRLRKFREVFTSALKQVCAVYQDARIDVTEQGMTLRNSPPPVKKMQILLP